MKNYNRVIVLSFVSIVIGVYLFILVLTTKPTFKMNNGSMSIDPINVYGVYEVHGIGSVVSNNKYRVESATVKVTVYDENDVEITSKLFEYKEGKLIEYYFKMTDSIPKSFDQEVIYAKIHNKSDLFISLILISFGLLTAIPAYIDKKAKSEINIITKSH